LEEIVMATRMLYEDNTGIDPKALMDLSSLVARASGKAVAYNKSIVGSGVFTHESGIHTDGLMKYEALYECFSPSVLGRSNKIVLGKHSGTSSVREAYGKMGIPLSDAQAATVLKHVRDHAMTTKQAPTTSDLVRFLMK
jgi:homocitrate synthase NifV